MWIEEILFIKKNEKLKTSTGEAVWEIIVAEEDDDESIEMPESCLIQLRDVLNSQDLPEAETKTDDLLASPAQLRREYEEDMKHGIEDEKLRKRIFGKEG